MSPSGGTPFVPFIWSWNRIYLILFAPHAFASQGQEGPRALPSPLVFRMISTDFTPTPCVPSPSNLL